MASQRFLSKIRLPLAFGFGANRRNLPYGKSYDALRAVMRLRRDDSPCEVMSLNNVSEGNSSLITRRSRS